MCTRRGVLSDVSLGSPRVVASNNALEAGAACRARLVHMMGGRTALRSQVPAAVAHPPASDRAYTRERQTASRTRGPAACSRRVDGVGPAALMVSGAVARCARGST